MTTKTKDTPGPWHFHLGRGSKPRFHIQNEGGYQIASTTELTTRQTAKLAADFEENQSREANARLIALSPQMLDSLKRVIPWLGKMIADKAHLNAVAPLDAENALKEAEALIAKATA